ncbi:MBL fold metallo-hydrolase [Sporosarcina sp. Marseille-Q4943]|uniref:MBL fold metallo-hydrolase n=1 Tax=Sporosarcina sp. Marseille-Q4943 TaxID=2942204 RepID=UPI00208DABBF|nr:MBL fold metallo-hydrolase [Sporosarcina sp. Marseille-Q4943]
MIRIETLATGSTGNCYLIDDDRTQLLLECGIRFKDIRRKLNFRTSSVAGILISHSHKDHCKGVSSALDASLDVYMSGATASEIGISHNRIRLYENKKQFRIGTFTILPFDVQHDVENHGFLIQSDNGSKLLFATDTYYVKYKFKGLSHLMIECNYSRKILDENVESGRVPQFLANRIIGSHFSLENVLDFLKANDLSKVQEIHLLHLSDSNSDEGMFKQEVQSATGKLVYVP